MERGGCAQRADSGSAIPGDSKAGDGAFAQCDIILSDAPAKGLKKGTQRLFTVLRGRDYNQTASGNEDPLHLSKERTHIAEIVSPLLCGWSPQLRIVRNGQYNEFLPEFQQNKLPITHRVITTEDLMVTDGRLPYPTS